LVSAARDLVYRRGVARTTLADIADAADVPVGNVYYYFKTKDDIVGAVVDAHVEQLKTDIGELERRHRSPKARLKALVDVVLAERGEVVAEFGCPLGTLSSELAKHAGRADRMAAPLMQVSLDWVAQQFRAVGRRDAPDLAVELVASVQGTTVLGHALARPELVLRQSRRLKKWIDTL
jgi:AcrR family transcriptional regulator